MSTLRLHAKQSAMTTSRTVLFSATVACLTAWTAQAQDVLVEADRVVVTPDLVLEPGALFLRAGKVAYVGDEIPAELRERADKRTFKGTLVPGFVLAHASLDQQEDLLEPISAFTPGLRSADAFDPYGKALQRAVHRGVTAVGFAPGSRNTFAGLAAIVKPGGVNEPGTAIKDDAYLKVALVPMARQNDRWPTSLIGATDFLRTAFAAINDPTEWLPKLATMDAPSTTRESLAILRESISGARRIFVHANSRAEIAAAFDVFEGAKVTPVLLGAAELDDLMDRARALGISVVLGPRTPGMKNEDLQLPVLLEKAGIQFSFTGEEPDSLRLSAALALRAGVSRKTAIAALTSVPAAQLNASEQLGSLSVGADADFTVFTGDPLDLTSRLTHVFVAGRMVHGTTKREDAAAQANSSAETPR